VTEHLCFSCLFALSSCDFVLNVCLSVKCLAERR
jgi:hypothetical protein